MFRRNFAYIGTMLFRPRCYVDIRPRPYTPWKHINAFVVFRAKIPLTSQSYRASFVAGFSFQRTRLLWTSFEINARFVPWEWSRGCWKFLISKLLWLFSTLSLLRERNSLGKWFEVCVNPVYAWINISFSILESSIMVRENFLDLGIRGSRFFFSVEENFLLNGGKSFKDGVCKECEGWITSSRQNFIFVPFLKVSL